MIYELINRELNLWSCSIADMTMEQIECFLKQWNDGSRIGALTLFYDMKEKAIVLNRDHKNYDFYLKVCTRYLSIGKDKREQFAAKIKSDTAHDVIDILDTAIQTAENQHTLFLMDNQPLIPDEFNVYWDMYRLIMQKYPNSHPSIWMFKAFKCGVMQGKRMERAKKKRRQQSQALKEGAHSGHKDSSLLRAPGGAASDP